MRLHEWVLEILTTLDGKYHQEKAGQRDGECMLRSLCVKVSQELVNSRDWQSFLNLQNMINSEYHRSAESVHHH